MSGTLVPYDYFFHSPERHLRAAGPEISPREDEFYTLLSQKTHPQQLFVYWNSEITAHPGTYGHAHAAKGYTIALSKQLPLAELCVPDASVGKSQFLLSSRWFGHIAAVKIPRAAFPKDMQERDMKQVIESVVRTFDGSASDFRAQRAALAESILGTTVAPTNPTDAFTWPAGIYGSGHFCGVYKENNRRLVGGAPDEYYLLVHSDSDILGEYLHGYAVSHPSLALGRLVASSQYEAVRSYASRNALRVLAGLADALMLDRTLVPRVEDLKARVPPHDLAPPELVADPYVNTEYNTFHEPIASGQTLVYFNTTARLAPSANVGSRVAILRNAKHGVGILQLDPTTDYSVLRRNVISGPTASHAVAYPNPHSAIPVGLGRIPDENTEHRLAISSLTSEDAIALRGSYYWGGKPACGADEVIDQQHLDPRLYSYRPVDARTEALVTFMLGSGPCSRVTNLSPVAVILPHNEK